MWKLIIDGARDGGSNMSIDASLLEEVEASPEPRTIVRFYGWQTPTISLGRNQKIDRALDTGYCRDNGIDIVHRPTGGRAVLHDDELTYAVISSDSNVFGDTIYGNYKRVSEALCLGYNRLGVPAVLAPDTRKVADLSAEAQARQGAASSREAQARQGAASNDDMDLPCFLSTSRYELMVSGRKIVGSAQRRVRRSFLQHGSMPITCDRDALARATRMADAASLETEMAGVAEFLPERPTLEQLRGAFIRAFQDYFSIEFML